MLSAFDLVVIGLLYMAYPDGRHKLIFLPRLRPYPMRGHWLLNAECMCMNGAYCM